MNVSQGGDTYGWTVAQTVASFAALAAIVTAIFALVNEQVQRVRGRDIGSVAADRAKMGHFYVPRVTW